MRYLRHSDLETTLKYIADEDDEQLRETVDRTFAGVGSAIRAVLILFVVLSCTWIGRAEGKDAVIIPDAPRPQAVVVHEFFANKTNVVLSGTEITVRLLDAIATRQAIRNHCHCLQEGGNIVGLTLKPVAATAPGQYAYSLGFATGQIEVARLLWDHHPSRHVKLYPRPGEGHLELRHRLRSDARRGSQLGGDWGSGAEKEDTPPDRCGGDSMKNAVIIARINKIRRRGEIQLRGWLPTPDGPRLVTLEADAVRSVLLEAGRHNPARCHLVVRAGVGYLLHDGDPAPPRPQYKKRDKRGLHAGEVINVVQEEEEPIITPPVVKSVIMPPIVQASVNPSAVGVAAIMTPLREQFLQSLLRRGWDAER
jgi:hypothetical protein